MSAIGRHDDPVTMRLGGAPTVDRGSVREGRGSCAAWPVAVLAVLTACTSDTAGSSATGPPVGGGEPTSIAAPPPTTGTNGMPTATAESVVHPVATIVLSGDPAVATEGPPAEGTWPAILVDRLGQDGAPMVVRTVGGDGAGFVSGGSSSLSFTDLVRAEVRPSTQLVVFHDTGWRDAPAGVIEEAASAAFKATEEVAPDARVVLILSAADSDTRSALTAAARGAELPVTVVDVTSEDWPASAGQEQFADLLAPYLVDLVRALARSGAFE